MHLHAEHSLFFERRQPLRVATFGIALTACVLIFNAGARSATLSLIGSGIGALLLLFAQARGRRRIKPVLAWTLALVALALLGGAVLDSNAEVVVQTSVRILCGAIWILWLGTQVDWTSLRRLLLRLRIPEGVVASLDHALMHGVLTQREWVQRRDAARLRLGSPRLPLAAWGPLLGEGALHAFVRLERAEENALLRGASRRRSSGSWRRPPRCRRRRTRWAVGARAARNPLGKRGVAARVWAKWSRQDEPVAAARGARRTHGRDHDPPRKPRVARCDAPRPAPWTRGASRPEPGTPLHRKHRRRGHRLGPASSWRRAGRGAASVARDGDGLAHRPSAGAAVPSAQLRGAAPGRGGRSTGARSRVAPPRRAHGRARSRRGPRVAHARCRGRSSDGRLVRLGHPLPPLGAVRGNACRPAARPAGALRRIHGGRAVGTVARSGRSRRREGEQSAC